MAPPGPVKIGHEKDGRQRRPHRFHVSRPPPLPSRWIRYCIHTRFAMIASNDCRIKCHTRYFQLEYFRKSIVPLRDIDNLKACKAF